MKCFSALRVGTNFNVKVNMLGGLLGNSLCSYIGVGICNMKADCKYIDSLRDRLKQILIEMFEISNAESF